ncbi:GSCFA domain-containing protein [Yoonia sp. BS5-3]|uniref:GSCFA domain-containing protein n=1 Tax=Yoonia phaeophyticola TaxID=3137369 RepID=A0ABZ2VBJ9_9RHOB
MNASPYSKMPPAAFWRNSVAEAGIFGLTDLWKSPWTLPKNATFATYGSCFAQHISRALVARKMNWINAEAAPGRTPTAIAKKYNYGIFSSRTGNIYTAAQMLTWARLAAEIESIDTVELWTDKDGRVHDMLRPGIEPSGCKDDASTRLSLQSTQRAFLRSIKEADVFVFTLGLTEGWVNKQTGQAYTLCPGTSVGAFDPEVHAFKNYTYPEIHADLVTAFDILKTINPDIHILLTVSPVPLVATASGGHVLVATQYSKSVLRAVAGDLAQEHAHIDYFPSYEIIASPPSRAAFFEPDMRSVAPQGVEYVMSHFFGGLSFSNVARQAGGIPTADVEEQSLAEMAAEDLVCEEILLEKFNDN